MKKIIFSFVSLLCLYSVRGFSQDHQLEKSFFKEQLICINSVKPLALFKKYDNDLKKTFLINNSKKIRLISNCNEKRIVVSKDQDTTFFLNNTILEILYIPGFEKLAFNSISKAVEENENKDSEFKEFVKPGKFFCLDSMKCRIIIISINSCANPKLFEEVIELLKKENLYEKVIAIRCGADKNDIVKF